MKQETIDRYRSNSFGKLILDRFINLTRLASQVKISRQELHSIAIGKSKMPVEIALLVAEVIPGIEYTDIWEPREYKNPEQK